MRFCKGGIIILDLNSNEKVLLIHYSCINPIESIISKVYNGTLVINLLKTFSNNLKIMEEDPLVIIYEKNNLVNMISGSIKKINLRKRNILEILIDEINIEYEYFPVSIYMNIRKKGDSKKNAAIMKKLGLYIIQICSESDYSA